jgi:2-C-methyl-D-erythritol 4-phosphate cytidylyltransferase
MGRLPTKKQYLPLANRPVLAHTIGAFDRNTAVDAIYVVVAEADVAFCRSVAVQPYSFKKVASIVVGGATRQESVFNGLRALPADTDYVMVHDGVRPFVTDGIISACLEAAVEWGAAAAAVPVKDTIKITDDEGFVMNTPERRQVWAVQTPQAFQMALLLEAHRRACQTGIEATDDATLVEQLGFKVKLVMGSYRNIKITTPEDLIVAEALNMQNAECRMQNAD